MPDHHRKYLLVAAMPTPNGALHLGHVAAQYLPLDIFRRYQQQQGHKVAFYCGFDVYDNAVCVAAKQAGLSPHEHARLVTQQIEGELQWLGIGLNRLVNYAAADVVTMARKLVGELAKAFGVRLLSRSERFPFGKEGVPLGGNWLRGQCIYCGRPTKGYSCDPCGRSLLPSELRDLQAIDGSPISWRPVQLQFVRVPTDGLLAYIDAIPAARPFVDQVRNRLDEQELDLQWTNVDSWGLPLGSENDSCVFYNRNFTLLEQLLVGDLARRDLGLSVNAFTPSSEATTILAYGKDNVGLLLVDIPALAFASQYYRPYQHQWISPFYNINGKKMSTSSNDAIWVRDVRDVCPEAVRLYICRRFSTTEDANLSFAGLHAENDAYLRLMATVRVALSEAREAAPSNPDVEVQRLQALQEIAAIMNDAYADIAVFAKVIDRWLERRSAASAWQWLHGLVDLAAPALPQLCEAIRRQLREHA